MSAALVGHSGFVGRNLQRQRAWDACFDRANVDAIRGRSFERIVCAGLPADRWQANGNPGGDRSNMLALAGALAQARAERFVLLSTIDVYPVPVGVDESTPFEPGGGQAYAEHRLEFERIVAGLFPRCHVLRLPATFGPGARRNLLVDLVRRRDLDAIDPQGSLQWYPVDRLADDVDRAVEHGLPLVNLCSEPVPTARLHREFFDDLRIGGRPGPSVRQDVRTRHGRAFGGDERYALGAEDVVAAVGAWLRALGQFGEPV
jgi:nucleoside-diphosphate-sugar epimerase